MTDCSGQSLASLDWINRKASGIEPPVSSSTGAGIGEYNAQSLEIAIYLAETVGNLGPSIAENGAAGGNALKQF
jgi:hypothetical protein